MASAHPPFPYQLHDRRIAHLDRSVRILNGSYTSANESTSLLFWAKSRTKAAVSISATARHGGFAYAIAGEAKVDMVEVELAPEDGLVAHPRTAGAAPLGDRSAVEDHRGGSRKGRGLLVCYKGSASAFMKKTIPTREKNMQSDARPQESAGHIRLTHADTLPSRTAQAQAKPEKMGGTVAVPSTGAHEHLKLALEVLSQRNRQIDEALARRAALRAEKEAIRKQIDALNLALPAFSEMIGVVPDCHLDIALAESSKLEDLPPTSTLVEKRVGRKLLSPRRARSKHLNVGSRLEAMERIINQLGARPTTRQMAQLLAGEGFAVSHVQVFKDYRTLKNKS